MKTCLYLLLLFLALSSFSFSQQIDSEYFEENIEVYFKFYLTDEINLKTLTRIISIDNVTSGEVYAYANEEEYNQFLELGIKHHILQRPGTLIKPEMSDDINKIMDWNTYPTYEAYVSMMNQFAIMNPDICQLIDGGNSTQGRKILFVKISDNVSVREPEPQFFYTSTMHGDETTGYVLMLRLIDSLLTSYGSDEKITDLVNNVEIWINPLANPDGTYHGGNHTVNGATRYNANGYDLNRNFPDPEYGTHANEQPETIIFKTLAEQNNFVLCANFHGGAEVVNYPWDTWTAGYPDYITHPDDIWFQFTSHLYADTAQAFSPSFYMDGFNDGITNGGDWYVIHGGRQDYMNYFMHSREVTIELSNTKLLPASQLPALWEYNKRSLLNYIENTLYGVRGIITDTLGNPIKTLVTVEGHDNMNSEIFSDSVNGNYHRMLSSGNYSITFSAPNYFAKTIDNIIVTDFNTSTADVQLIPDEPIPVELISFAGEGKNKSIILTWVTASEVNNQGFEIQKLNQPLDTLWGEEQKEWVKISFLSGYGTTTEMQIYTFVDDNVFSGSYYYRLKQIDYDGTAEYSNIIEVKVGLLTEFSLEQNYPNPFNPTTKIKFAIPAVEAGHAPSVQLIVYDILGNEVATLVNKDQVAGIYEVEFSAKGGSPSGGDTWNLPSGVYFYQLIAGSFIQTKKMILMR